MKKYYGLNSIKDRGVYLPKEELIKLVGEAKAKELMSDPIQGNVFIDD